MLKPIIFSDIDGTFLDESYRNNFSEDFLLKTVSDFEIIFVSSRTADEIMFLQKSLGWHYDFIAENGGVIGLKHPSKKLLFPQIARNDYTLCLTGKKINDFKHGVAGIIRKFQQQIKIFNDLEPTVAASISSYDVLSALRALNRLTTLLLKIDNPSSELLDCLTDRLKQDGLNLNYGGRWFSVSSGFNKGEAVKQYLDIIDYKNHTYAVGNSDNDFELLAVCDFPFIINDHGYNKTLIEIPSAIKLAAIGTDGWQEMIEIIRNKY